MSSGKQSLGATAKSKRSRSKRTRPSENRGGRLNVGSNPPQVTYQPWYNLIISDMHTDGKDYTPAKIVSLITTQLDPHKHGFTATNLRLQFRLLEVRSWNLNGRNIGLAIDDYSVRNKSDQEQICGIIDSGTALHVPGVGFKTPISLANLVLRNDNDDKDDTIVHIVAPAKSQCVTYLTVCWRFDGPIKLTSFSTEFERLIGSNNVIRADVRKLTEYAKDFSENSRTNVILNSISKAAEVVTPVLLAEDRDIIRDLCDSMRTLASNFKPPSDCSVIDLQDVDDVSETDGK